MGNVIVTEFVTLDGVAESPEKWSLDFWNAETEKFKNEELDRSGALLLGRKTYQGFAEAWPGRGGAYADKLNRMPKYVASKTLKAVDWSGAELLRSGMPEAIAKLKNASGDDIVVHGSISLAQGLLKYGLVDRISLLVYPVVLGRGARFFEDGHECRLDCVSATRFSSGVLALDLRPKL